MQTPAIQNPVNPAAGLKSTATSTDNSGSGVSFQNMLSQQVAERQPTKPADNAQAPAQQAAKPADNSAPAEAQAPKAENTKEASDGTATDGTAQAGKGTETEDGKKIAADAAAAATAIPPTATELIAQALNLPARSVDTKTDAKTSDAKKPADILVASGQAALARGRMLAANETNTKTGIAEKTSLLADRTGKPAVESAKAGDFSAAMKQAGEQKALPAAAAAAAEAQTQAKAAALQAAEDHAAPVTALTANPAHLQQAGGVDMAQAANGQAERLTPRVGTPAWDQALGQKVVWMVGGAQQSASLTLNPPDLGPLQVVLNVSNGQADASFYAAQPEVRQALEAALPKLRDMMSDAGVQLGQTSVSAGMPDQFNQADRQQSQQTGRNGGQSQDQQEAAQTIRTQAITTGNGLVDTFV